ncbi:MAG: hypothetical protein M1833_003592 [Piccolia ochrophora]|nr:MAG: hypothetical protein M1833_003592 [Piccolia ochrophora]
MSERETTTIGEPQSNLDNGYPEEKRSNSNHTPSPSAPEDEETAYPEGGLKAWSVVFGSFCGQLTGFGVMNTIGIFQAHISANQLKDYSEGQVGWIFSLYVFLSFFCGVQIGPVFDAHGPRLLILAGSVCLVASMMLLGLCTSYWHFIIVFGILGGLGTSLVFTPAIGSIGHFFLAGRANATGLSATGGSVGGVVFPLMLQSLIPRIGFAWSTRILGFIFVVLTGVANLLIRSRLAPETGASAWPDLRIFRNAVFALTTAGVFLVEWGLFIPLGYITSYTLAQHDVAPAFAYQLLAILNAASFFGRWVPGYVADRLGRFNTMIVTVALCVVATFALWLPARGSVALLVAYAVLFGFASGSNISLTAVCVGQLCKTENYGRYYATCYTIVSFGTLTGIPAAGAIVSAEGGAYRGLILFTGMCYVGGLAMFLAARILAVGWRVTTVY